MPERELGVRDYDAIILSAERAADRMRRWQLVHAALTIMAVASLMVVVDMTLNIQHVRIADKLHGVAASAVWAISLYLRAHVRRWIRHEGRAHHRLADLGRLIESMRSDPAERRIVYEHYRARLCCLDIGFDEVSYLESMVLGSPQERTEP